MSQPTNQPTNQIENTSAVQRRIARNQATLTDNACTRVLDAAQAVSRAALYRGRHSGSAKE
jgi:hypothetical protein